MIHILVTFLRAPFPAAQRDCCAIISTNAATTCFHFFAGVLGRSVNVNADAPAIAVSDLGNRGAWHGGPKHFSELIAAGATLDGRDFVSSA